MAFLALPWDCGPISNLLTHILECFIFDEYSIHYSWSYLPVHQIPVALFVMIMSPMRVSQAVRCYWGVLASALEPITSWGSSLSNSRAEWANCLAVAIATPLLLLLMLVYFTCGFCSHCEATAQWKGVCWGLQWTRVELIWYPCTIGLTWFSIPASFPWSSDFSPNQCRVVPTSRWDRSSGSTEALRSMDPLVFHWGRGTEAGGS